MRACTTDALGFIFVRIGNRKASVLPEPVGANSIRLFPVAAFSIAFVCITFNSAIERFFKYNSCSALRFFFMAAKVSYC